MSNILLFTCLLAICLPILSVHLSRRPYTHTLLSRIRSTHAAEPRSEGRAGPLRRRSVAALSSLSPSHPHSHSQNSLSRSRPQTDGTASEASDNDTDHTPQLRLRKPWDPPFPRREGTGKGSGSAGGSWLVLPPRGDSAPNSTMAKSAAQRGDQDATTASSLSVFALVLRVLSVLLLILAFAILIAHCLAWFLVYKTEARLGEARRGMIRGGDMRLCLCAK